MITSLPKAEREAVIQDVLDSVRRNLPTAMLQFEHTAAGIHIRVSPKQPGRESQCVEITIKGKRCSYDKQVGDLCELHHNMRRRRQEKMDE